MWNLDFSKFEPFVSTSLGSIAIETGTCRGNGAIALAKKFRQVFTIELSVSLYAQAQHRLLSLNNVSCLQGNSAEALAQLLPSLPENEPIFFFLDAHWSGDSSVDWNLSKWKGYGLDTAHLGDGQQPPSGPEQCPLLEELAAITTHCRAPAHILIDDTKNLPPSGPGYRHQSFHGEDWSHLSTEQIRKILEPRLLAFHELSNPDQYFISLNRGQG